MPKDRVGDKKYAYPMKDLHPPKRGAAAGSHGVVGRTRDGYVQSKYCIPLTAPLHISRDTNRLYASVYHKWANVDQGAHAYDPRPKSKPQARASTPKTEHPSVHGVTPRGREWAHRLPIKEE